MLITIGAFDGFHKGHQELFRLCRENSRGDNWGVLSFWPHPAEYMHKFPHTLFTHKEIALVNELCVDGEEFIGFGKYAGYDYVRPDVIVPKR